MSGKTRREKRICHSEKDFERIFLPETHERKARETVMKDPKKFEEHLKEKLMGCIVRK
jgi:hypothetical protein